MCGSVPGDEPVVLAVDPDSEGARHLYRRVGFVDLPPFALTSMYLLSMKPQMLMGLRRARDAGAAVSDE